MNLTGRMAILEPLRRGAVLLAAGNLIAALLMLGRNLLIARMIGVEDFGIASTFALAVALVEAGTNMALDRMAVQDRRAGQRRMLAALHGVQLLRGVVGAALLFAVAHPFATMMGVPEAAWAYEYLALVPLLRALLHLGVFRAQRRMRFVPQLSIQLAAHATALLASWPLAIWLGDYRVMLCAVLIHQAVYVAGSHLVGGRRYRATWNTPVFRDAMRFGLPLTANGLVMFATLNGDPLLVGSHLGMEVLGAFAVATMLSLVPSQILANVLQSLLLPGLSRARFDLPVFAARSRATLLTSVCMACAMSVGIAGIGPAAVLLLFGPEYAAAAAILPWLALLQGIRLAKAGPAIIAIARAETMDPLLANLPRLAALPIAALWLMQGGGLDAVVAMAILGESAALVLAYVLLIRRGLVRLPRVEGRVRHG